MLLPAPQAPSPPVPLGRLEHPANGLGNRCSIHLSYRGVVAALELSKGGDAGGGSGRGLTWPGKRLATLRASAWLSHAAACSCRHPAGGAARAPKRPAISR